MNNSGRKITNILHVNAEDIGGGAARIAYSLMQRQIAEGLNTCMAVGNKKSSQQNIHQIPDFKKLSSSQKTFDKFKKFLERDKIKNLPGAWRLSRLCNYLISPRRYKLLKNGSDICGLAGSDEIDRLSAQPDIIHCHNLHGGYFELKALGILSQKYPLIITAHDRWLTAGHCAHPLGCKRWLTGCGNCPDLSLPPAIPADRTANNYLDKLNIYKESRLYIAAPCSWLARKLRRSILTNGIEKISVINNGIDTNTFCPSDKSHAREALALPQNAKIILFAANGASTNPWKDIATLLEAAKILSEKLSNLHFIILGDNQTIQDNCSTLCNVIYRPFTTSTAEMADYFRAADIYLHVAKAETFPNVIIEALACGTPVVANKVGGISEQIRCLSDNSPDTATGVMCKSENADALAAAAEKILIDNALHRKLSANAASDAKDRFSLDLCAERYNKFYADAYNDFHNSRGNS